jgi:cytochrome c oxidase subunit 2
MKRRSHDKVVHTEAPLKKRRRTGGRVLTLGTLGMVAMLLLTACGPNVEKPYSTISPVSPTARDIQSLYELIFWLALVVFVGVQFAIVYSALRFRRPKAAKQRPPQVHGNSRLEIAWTVLPAVVLLVILIPTITTMYAHDDALDDATLEVDVYGKQWWWEVHYGEDQAQGGENLGIITANEIHIPEGRNVKFNLRTNNVIHSFWVPRLSGKLDLVPGHVNQLSITAEESGEYFGECAEFCGTQHAWMRFKVIVHPEAEFYKWVNDQRAGNPAVTANQDAPEGVEQAPQAFSLCLSCHTVNGISQYGATGLTAPASFGPDLTNLGCRDTLAAGMLINNQENLEKWVNDPGAVKPGNYMADTVTPGLIRETYGDEGFNDLIGFLMGLQPEGGCAGAEGSTNTATPAASPVAIPANTEATPGAG